MAENKTSGGGKGTERADGETHYEKVKRSPTLTEIIRRPGPAPAKDKTPPAESSQDPNEPNRSN